MTAGEGEVVTITLSAEEVAASRLTAGRYRIARRVEVEGGMVELWLEPCADDEATRYVEPTSGG